MEPVTLGDVLYVFIIKTRTVPTFLFPNDLDPTLIKIHNSWRRPRYLWLLSTRLPT